MKEIIDFGLPNTVGGHHFFIEQTEEGVALYEDFGFAADCGDTQAVQCRAKLLSKKWSRISSLVKRHFNSRLKEKSLPAGRWNAGKTKIDRHLGRELCLLMWAIEDGGAKDVVFDRWIALRPEERWWIYSRILSDKTGGWRKALINILAPNPLM